MKPSNTFTGFLLFSLIATSAFTKPHIDIVGNVYCCSGESQLPIGNITVELKDIPFERTRTKTSNGYYRIRGPFERLYNHNVTVVFRIGKRILHEETAFILPDSRLRKRNGSLVYKMDDVRLDMECAILKKMVFDNIRNKDVESEESKGYEALTSPASFLRYLFLHIGTPFGEPPGPTITRIEESDLPI